MKTYFVILLLVLGLLAPIDAYAQESGVPQGILNQLQRSNLDQASRDLLPKEVVEVLGTNAGRHWEPGKCIALSPNQKIIASGSRDKTVRLWDSESLLELRRFAHPDDVDAVHFNKESDHLLTECWDGVLRIFDLRSDSDLPVTMLQIDSPGTKTAYHQSTGLLYASTTNSRKSRLESLKIDEYQWDKASLVKTGRTFDQLFTLNALPPALAVSNSGRWLCAATEEPNGAYGIVCLWDLKSDKSSPKTIKIFEEENATSLAFDAAETCLIAGASRGALGIVDLANPSGIVTAKGHEKEIRALQFSEDGKYLMTGSYDHTIHVYAWKDKAVQYVETLSGHSGWVTGIVFSRDGSRLFSIGWEGAIRQWFHENDGWSLKPIVGHQNSVHAIAFSEDSNWIATGASSEFVVEPLSNDVLLWKLDGGRFKLDRNLAGAIGDIHSLSFSKDGKFLVAGAGNGIVSWEIGNGDRSSVLGYKLEQYGKEFDQSGYFVSMLGQSHTAIAGWNYRRVSLIDFDSKQPTVLDSWESPFHYVEDVAVSEDGKQVFVSSIPLQIVDKKLKQIKPSAELEAANKEKAAPPKEVGEFLLYHPIKQALSPVGLSRDNRFLVGGNRKGQIIIYDLKSANEPSPKIIQGHNIALQKIDFSRKGKMVSADVYGLFKFWDFAHDTTPINSIQLDRPWSLKFSPEGTHVAVGSGSGLVYILKVD